MIDSVISMARKKWNQNYRSVCCRALTIVSLFSLNNKALAERVCFLNTAKRNVTVYDPEKKSSDHQISIAAESNGFGSGANTLAVTPDGKIAYIADYKNKSVIALSMTDYSVATTIAVAQPPRQVAVAPDGKKAYIVSDPEASNKTTPAEVYILDIEKNQILKTFQTNLESIGCAAVSPDGSRLFVAGWPRQLKSNPSLTSRGCVEIYATATNKFLGSAEAGTEPSQIVFSRNGKKAYVVSCLGGSVTVVNTGSFKVEANLAPLAGPWGVAVAPDDNTLYVPSVIFGDSETKGGLFEITTNNPPPDTYVGTNFTPFSARNFGAALSADGKTIYIAHGTDADVSVMDIATREVSSLPGIKANAVVTEEPPRLPSEISQGVIGPSEIVLAKLSQYTYEAGKTSTIPAPFDGYNLTQPIFGRDSFTAYVFQKDNQIVLAFRGTALDLEAYTTIDHALVDISFFWNTSRTRTFNSHIQQAVYLLTDIHKKFPTACITLTGHSLGGAIAQILGKKSNLPVLAFNAPGTKGLYPYLNKVLSPLNTSVFANKGANNNYRLDGDLISQIGDPIGYTWTIGQNTPVDWTDVVHNHSIDQLVIQIENEAPKVRGTTRPIPLRSNQTPAEPSTN